MGAMPIGYVGHADDPYVRLLQAYVEELEGLAVPQGPPRRALSRPASDVLAELRATIDRGIGEVVARRMMPSYLLGIHGTSLLGIGSVLYAAGAPHPTWRRWFALRAVAERHLGTWSAAVKLAAIAGEWKLVDAIDDTQEELDTADAALWRLLGKRAARVREPATQEVRWNDAWSALVVAAEAKDRPRIDRAFSTLVDEATSMDDRVTADRYVVDVQGDAGLSLMPWGWAPFCESGMVCAAAAILRRLDLAPGERIGVARLRYLEPGLATGDSWVGAHRFL
jgi:hypothetical protein